MIELNPGRFKTKPFDHQVDGVKFLISHSKAGLFDEQGTGKTKQFIDTACTLYEAGEIDTALVLCPSSVKLVWIRKEFGEIATHSWVPGYLSHYWTYQVKLLTQKQAEGRLYWIVTSYEFLRQQNRFAPLMQALAGRKVICFADESSFIKSWKAKQTKAAINVGRMCQRRYIGNGTPLTHSPVDLFSQMWFLDPKILNCQNVFQFRNRHLIMGGWNNKQIMGVKNMELLQRQIAPYVIRREKKDCLDLPEKMPAVGAEVPLSDETWRMYCEMRDYMITFLDQEGEERAMTKHAVVKIMRMAQLCSGLLGGIDPVLMDSDDNVKVVSGEKLAWFKEYMTQRLEEDPNHRTLAWCQFRKEQEVAAFNVAQTMKLPVVRVYGGQTRADRETAITRFTSGDGPMVLFGQPQAGGWGLNLQHRCHDVVYISCDYNLLTRLQSEDRVHRSGQKFAVNYTDCLATGPRGQKTIDHAKDAARRRKENMANFTTSAWKRILKEEVEELVF